MEGQEGNEIMYDLLLDQAWSKQAINTDDYFHDWATSRYHGAGHLPDGLYSAWDTMRRTVYNNSEIDIAQAVTKSIFELSPNTTGLLNRTGHHATTIQYEPSILVTAWEDLYGASEHEPSLWDNEAYTYDLTDVTRQVLANAFDPVYRNFTDSANKTRITYDHGQATKIGKQMLCLLSDLDSVLTASGHAHFSLSSWIAAARSWASSSNATNSSAAEVGQFYEYNARNQITLWGPEGQISDYASKQWGGLIKSYYIPRWQRFVDYTANSTTKANGENTALLASLTDFERGWQLQSWGKSLGESYGVPLRGELQRTIARVVRAWPDVFNQRT